MIMRDEAISRLVRACIRKRLPRPFGARNDNLNQNLPRKSCLTFTLFDFYYRIIVA